jgi:hypothetical protein
VSGAEDHGKRFTFGIRYIPDIVDRAKWRNTLTYRIHPRLTAGVEYNPLAGDLNPIANLLLLTETEKRPAIILGTSSDRIGTPDGTAFFVTASKNLQREINLPLAPYIGLSYGTYEDRLRPIGGLNVNLTDRLDALIIFDGVKVSPTLNYAYKEHIFSFILAQGKKPGISYSIRF